MISGEQQVGESMWTSHVGLPASLIGTANRRRRTSKAPEDLISGADTSRKYIHLPAVSDIRAAAATSRTSIDGDLVASNKLKLRHVVMKIEASPNQRSATLVGQLTWRAKIQR